MSQKKVDAYKQEKANRAQIMKKEKRMLMLEKAITLVVCAAVVVWIGFSVYGKATEGREAIVKETAMDTSALDNYMTGIAAEADAEEEDSVEADAEEEDSAEADAEEEDSAEEDTAEADSEEAE